MNISEIKNISIKNYLASIGCKIKADRGHYGMYLSPYRKDSSPSLKVDYNKNLWYDFGADEGGSIIDLVMKIEECIFTQAIEKLSKRSQSFSFHCQEFLTQEKNINILKVKKLENRALLQYLEFRCIDLQVAQTYCEEAYYGIGRKQYFAISFKNTSNSYELRNKYYKGCTGKDISVIQGEYSLPISIFEGFMDFLSFKSLYKEDDGICIVLNSVETIHKLEKYLQKGSLLNLYLDNDSAGDKASDRLMNKYEARDMRYLYANFKDLNEYLMNLK